MSEKALVLQAIQSGESKNVILNKFKISHSGQPVSATMLQEKALIFNEMLKGPATFKLLCSIPSWSIVYIAYLAPAFAMSGLHLSPDEETLITIWNYLAIGLLYLILQHLICLLFAHICKWAFLAALLSGLVIGEISLAGGVTLHLENLPSWYQEFSPLRWTLSLLLPQIHGEEIMKKLIKCKGKHVQQHDIIVQETCETPTIPPGTLALKEVALDKISEGSEVWLGISVVVVVILIVIAFLCIRYGTPKRPRSAPNKP